MKKNLIALALISVAVLAGTGKTNAQLVSTRSSLEYHKDLPGDQNNISPKAIRGFEKDHANVTNESWMQIKDGFSARFNSNGIKTTILYDKKGNWAGSIKSYGEDNLQHDIRHIVKSVYYDYRIAFAQEIETLESGGVPTYIVFLEDNTSIKLVRIFGGEMSVWKDYTKAH